MGPAERGFDLIWREEFSRKRDLGSRHVMNLDLFKLFNGRLATEQSLAGKACCQETDCAERKAIRERAPCSFRAHRRSLAVCGQAAPDSAHAAPSVASQRYHPSCRRAIPPPASASAPAAPSFQ